MSGIGKILGNATSVLSNDVVNRASTFFIYALIARRIGADGFGQLSLALTLYATFQVFAIAGLKTLATREIAKDRSHTNLYLVNGLCVVIVASLLSVLCVAGLSLLLGYPRSTAIVIVTIALCLFPFSVSAMCEAIFQGWERMQYIALANIPANCVKVGLAFAMLERGASIQQIALLLLGCQSVATLSEWILLKRLLEPKWTLDPKFALKMVRQTTTFLGIDGLIAVMGSTNLLMVSKFASQQDAGYYNAATQMLAPVALIFQNVAISVFPRMCQHFGSTRQSLRQVAEHTIELLLMIAVPTALGIYMLSESGLALLYVKRDFLAAAPAVRILVWTLILSAITNVLGPVLIASLRERLSLRIVAINLTVSLLLGYILIPKFGVIGAAATALLTRIVDFGQHYTRAIRVIPELQLWSAIWEPALASAVMVVYIAVNRGRGVWTTVLAAGFLYLIVLLLLLLALNGPQRLKARYLYGILD